MQLHPRTQLVAKARNEIGLAINTIAEQAGLTYIEIFGILGNEIATVAKYALRQERHPETPDKSADEA